MARTKIMLQIQSNETMNDQMVIVGERLIKQWKIPTHQLITLRFGSLHYTIKVIPSSHASGIRLSESLARKMGVAPNIKIGMQYKSSARTLVLGPLIGIMMGRIGTVSTEKPFGETTPFCREVVDACKQLGAFVYFFAIHDLNANSSTLQGWSYSNRWRRAQYPIPDVIYNRLMSRKYENKPSVQHFMKEVKSRYGTAIFNEKYLNKTDVFDALKHESSVTRFLPESHLLRGFPTLQSMCNKYSIVYLKPITGSLGKGIIRIVNQNGFTCHFATLNGSVKKSYPSLVKLYAAISGKVKSRRFQIQQGLRLVRANNRPVDFRALVQRNAQGNWAITSVVARIAGNNQIVSNLARGGILSPVKDALRKTNLNPTQRKTVYTQLHKAALEIAKGIEANVTGHFAELGIDLAVDTNGRVWLLEVNSKPAKNDAPLTDTGKVRPSVKQMILYSRFLAGF